MKKADKQQIVDTVNGVFKASNIAIVAHYRGLNVAEMTQLRRDVRAAGGQVQVVKNTLTKRAAKGTDFESLDQLLTGPTALITAVEPVATSKAVIKFAKDNKTLEILGGAMDGDGIDLGQITALSLLPSREELLAKLMGSLMSPAQGLVTVLNAVPTGLVRALDQVRQQKEEAEAAG